jgi:ATP-dependent RNA helicase RhlE
MSFEDLGLRPEILRAVVEQGYTEPTPIQAEAIPVVLQGRDIMAGAQTGTGKTAGFTLPLLHRLAAHASTSTSPAKHPIRALILTPTRELAAQVEESVRTYGKYLPLKATVIYGGVNMNPQIEALRSGVDIVVATPGRLLDHVQQKSINLSKVEFLVLDEADRMLDMGFLPDLRRIMSLLPAQRQSLLFSATFAEEIKRLSDSLLRDPVLIEVARRNTTAENVTQVAHPVDQARKRELLSHLIKTQDLRQVLVFSRTKHGADRLAHQLERDGILAVAIHGDKTQPQRTKALSDFKEGAVRVLVATDVAARGIDIDQLPHVFNFEMPNSPEDYVHRIGRTGRAGSQGDAISLVCDEEMRMLAEIERLIKREIPKVIVAGFEPGSAPKTEAPPRERGRERSPQRRPELPPAAEHHAQRAPSEGMPKPAANNHHLKQPMGHAASHGKRPQRQVAALLGGLKQKGE